MHLPRRACSLLGILCVVLCCLLYVADYYDYYYSRTAVPERHREHEDAVADARAGPLLLPLAQLDARGGKAEGTEARETGAAALDASHAPGEQRKRKDQAAAARKKKRRCKKRKCKRTSAESEGDGDEADSRGDDDPTFTLDAVLAGAPVWSEFADRGYTIVGTNGSAMRRLPQVLIIGVKKAGTRALLEFLRVHPSIRAAGPEVHYFDRFYTRGLAWYRSQLPLSLEGQLTLEKTPAYFTTSGVPARVRADLPGVRLLLVVREPVTRALSDYAQGLSKREGSHKSFEEMAFVNVTTGLVNSNWGPISGGLYVRHLQHWLDHFPRSSIHVVSGENLVHDPAAELARVQEFLGLRRVITDKHFFFNATKGFPCLVKRERSGKPHCLGSSKGRSHPSVSPAAVEALRDFYRPFNFKFYKMVGQNFNW
ncbi:heparan sulfate glucosamine 3-O-sulfotransferase 6-like [Penaeus indicus]|uniref:heparan sulfate glucosamine 3-O-sulfotransferase 6-like n=1 Tax=Penaeus indicus TaxID=29960 RepID=UPI00300CDA50